jgi:peptidoglycan hydrolase-like protein with peptidoglycan-binding domain
MRPIVFVFAACLAVPAFAQDDNTEFVKRVQLALHLHGFDPGPINGDFGATQAALAKFQLSENLPASGALDEATMKALGVSRQVPPAEEARAEDEENASAGSGTPLARP